MSWYKVEATGNDFLIWTETSDTAARALNQQTIVVQGKAVDRAQISRLCDRHRGIGADGLIVLARVGLSWEWSFFNSDGSDAEMCGNATRAVGCILHGKGLMATDAPVTLKTVAGTVEISRVAENHWRTHLRYLKAMSPSLAAPDLKTPDFVKGLWFANTGVPHLVLEVDELRIGQSDLEFVRELRAPNKLRVTGANVTLLSQDQQTVTFERGVEDWTLSCGTGALAAGLVALRREGRLKGGESLTLVAPGGRLTVELDQDRTMALSGPAYLIARFEL
jgi:diaminopimelate epimerase